MRDEVRRSLRSLEPTEGGFSAVFAFAPELEVFEGHFHGLPLVPGVYLIEGVRLAAERVLERELRLDAIVEARFTARVDPGEAVRFRAELVSEENSSGTPIWFASANLECLDVSCARLRLRLAASTG
jgi:3-hydroxymyristoyl/3-hydroxydecanoyl-(acyl carrier protein) dehydratase